MSCTILNLKLQLQLLKHLMVLEQPRLKVDASQQYILAKGGQLHHNRTVLYSKGSNVHTLLYPAFIRTFPSRRKKVTFLSSQQQLKHLCLAKMIETDSPIWMRTMPHRVFYCKPNYLNAGNPFECFPTGQKDFTSLVKYFKVCHAWTIRASYFNSTQTGIAVICEIIYPFDTKIISRK